MGFILILMVLVTILYVCKRRSRSEVKPYSKADELYNIPPQVQIIRGTKPPDGTISTDSILKVPYRQPTTLPFLAGAVDSGSAAQGYPVSPISPNRRDGVHLPPIYQAPICHTQAYPIPYTATRSAKN